MAPSDRWSQDDLDNLKGLPWDLHPDQIRPPRAVQDREAPRLPPMRLESDSARAFYVQRRDIEKFGRTGTCPGCDAIARGSKRAVAHNTACRERIFDLVE